MNLLAVLFAGIHADRGLRGRLASVLLRGGGQPSPLTMPEDSAKPFRGVLEPVERLSEVLFGLIMVLTFTGSLSVAAAGRGAIRTMLIGALGCNLSTLPVVIPFIFIKEPGWHSDLAWNCRGDAISDRLWIWEIRRASSMADGPCHGCCGCSVRRNYDRDRRMTAVQQLGTLAVVALL